jgi:chemotaxis signal transduction protein
MTERQTELLMRLRTEFDRSFAVPARAEASGFVELLGFRVGETSYAVGLADVAAVHELRAVTRVPGQRLGFEGITFAQGQFVAVYDLAALIEARSESGSCRWLLISRQDRQVGFAVDAMDGYLRTSPDNVVAMPDQQLGSAVQQSVVEGSTTRLIVNFAALIDALARDTEREAGNRR